MNYQAVFMAGHGLGRSVDSKTRPMRLRIRQDRDFGAAAMAA